jgi:pyruvate formate lyase activating enzyme
MTIKRAILQIDTTRDGTKMCFVCMHRCLLRINDEGKCGVRKNIDGTVYVTSYGELASISIDPIEKKPLNQFLPNTMSYSIGGLGCNFKCDHCQNYMISQTLDVNKLERTPEEIIERALFRKCESISYTFTEPTVSIEFVLDCMKLAKENGLKNIWVTNGYITPLAFGFISDYLDAANVSIKGDADFYKKVCKAKLMPVLQTIRRMKKNNIHVEINCSVIPGYTDDTNENMRRIFEYLVYINPETILHLTKFQPSHIMEHILAPTGEQLSSMQKIASQAGIKYIYVET